MTNVEKYFYSKGMKTNCPCDAKKISELIRTGKIRPIDWMFTASKNWVVASSFTELKEDFNKQENAPMATVKKIATAR